MFIFSLFALNTIIFFTFSFFIIYITKLLLIIFFLPGGLGSLPLRLRQSQSRARSPRAVAK